MSRRSCGRPSTIRESLPGGPGSRVRWLPAGMWRAQRGLRSLAGAGQAGVRSAARRLALGSHLACPRREGHLLAGPSRAPRTRRVDWRPRVRRSRCHRGLPQRARQRRHVALSRDGFVDGYRRVGRIGFPRRPVPRAGGHPGAVSLPREAYDALCPPARRSGRRPRVPRLLRRTTPRSPRSGGRARPAPAGDRAMSARIRAAADSR